MGRLGWLALVMLASCKKTEPAEASAKPVPAITEPAEVCARYDLLEERAGKKKPERDQARRVCPEQMAIMQKNQPEQYACVVECVAKHDLYDELVGCSLACVLAHPAGSPSAR